MSLNISIIWNCSEFGKKDCFADLSARNAQIAISVLKTFLMQRVLS